jgi:hypothetical protein
LSVVCFGKQGTRLALSTPPEAAEIWQRESGRSCVAGYRLFGTSLAVTHILSVAPVVTNVTGVNQHNEPSRDLKALFVCLSAPALVFFFFFFWFQWAFLSLGFSAGAQVAGLGLMPQRGERQDE